MYLLANKNIKLVPIERRHLTKSLQWVNDRQIAEKLMRYLPVSKKEELQWYRTIQKDRARMVFAVEKDSKHIGNVGLYDIDYVHKKAELWIVIGEPKYRHRGFGRQCLTILFNYAFNCLNLNKIYLHVDQDNISAVRFYKSLGFKKEGRFKKDKYIEGRYRDILRLCIFNK